MYSFWITVGACIASPAVKGYLSEPSFTKFVYSMIKYVWKWKLFGESTHWLLLEPRCRTHQSKGDAGSLSMLKWNQNHVLTVGCCNRQQPTYLMLHCLWHYKTLPRLITSAVLDKVKPLTFHVESSHCCTVNKIRNHHVDGLAQDLCMTTVRWHSCCVVQKTSLQLSTTVVVKTSSEKLLFCG